MGKCNKPMEIYSRVTGFFRPTNSWNKGKREEFRDRVYYKVNIKKDKRESAG